MRLVGSAGDGAMALVLTILIVALLVSLAIAVASPFTPRSRVSLERQRIDREARFAQWRLQQVTSAAMQRLLDEARRRP